MEDVKIKTRTGALCTLNAPAYRVSSLISSDFHLVLYHPDVDADRVYRLSPDTS